MSSQHPLSRLPSDIMRKINKHSASTYENHVEMNFDWESNTSEIDPTGNCWATATLTWNPRIEQHWRDLMSEIVADILYPQYRSRNGKPVNDFLREINEEYDSIELTEISAIDPDGTNDDRVVLMISGMYGKEPIPDYPGEYYEMDFESDEGQTIKREFKRYVVDIMTSFMKALLSSPDTPPQPVMTCDKYGCAILYDGGEIYDEYDIDHEHDYKLQTTDVFFEKYWIDLLNGEYIVKQWRDGREYKAFQSTFTLVNNKRLPVSKKKEGVVVSQYKLKL